MINESSSSSICDDIFRAEFLQQIFSPRTEISNKLNFWLTHWELYNQWNSLILSRIVEKINVIVTNGMTHGGFHKGLQQKNSRWVFSNCIDWLIANGIGILDS